MDRHGVMTVTVTVPDQREKNEIAGLYYGIMGKE